MDCQGAQEEPERRPRGTVKGARARGPPCWLKVPGPPPGLPSGSSWAPWQSIKLSLSSSLRIAKIVVSIGFPSVSASVFEKPDSFKKNDVPTSCEFLFPFLIKRGLEGACKSSLIETYKRPIGPIRSMSPTKISQNLRKFWVSGQGALGPGGYNSMIPLSPPV